jgi:chemotaxis protein methyltransferase CheR
MLQGNDISQTDYERFRLFLEQACGIVLGDGKQYLNAIQRGHPRHLRDAVIDAMTTNETSWFRDGGPFEVFEKMTLADLETRVTAPCRIWSAACSSGQEPYTISMILNEYIRKKPDSKLKSTQIIATDISNSMLALARRGVYEEHALIRGISPARRQQFFKPFEGRWQIVDEVKQRVQFREQNLLQSYTGLGRFDVILCRNVLIYFSMQRKTDILTRLAQALNPGGYLFLGASETISGYTDAFDLQRTPHGVVYRRR